MDIQEFARCVIEEELGKDAGLKGTISLGAKSLKDIAGMGGGKYPRAKLMAGSAYGTGRTAAKDVGGILKALLSGAKSKATSAGKATSGYFGSPVKSVEELRAIAADKGWSLKDILNVARGEKLVGKGLGSDVAREQVKGIASRMGKGAVRGAAIGGGAGALGGAYAYGKKRGKK